MKGVRYREFVLFGLILFGLITPDSVGSEASQKENEKAKSEPIVIKSKTLEVNDKTKVVTFEGDVHADVKAKSDDFAIDCHKILVYYTNQPSQQQDSEAETTIEKIVAIGEVRIKRGQGGIATAEKAVYYQQDEKIVLTGNPVIKQENDFVEGDRITIFLEENRHVVESTGDKKVRAIIFPKGEKK
jgi:lipopolysaccharide export system protein LptA